MVRHLWKKHIWSHWVAIHAMKEESKDTVSSRPLIVYTAAAVSLTYLHYYGQAGFFVKAFGKYLKGNSYLDLYAQLFWSASCLVGYVLIPCLIIALLPGEKIRDYGLSITGFFAICESTPSFLQAYFLSFFCLLSRTDSYQSIPFTIFPGARVLSF